MTLLVVALLLNPLLSFLALSLAGKAKESSISLYLKFSILLQWILAVLLTIVWFTKGLPSSEGLLVTIYQQGDFNFSLYYLIDKISIAGLITVTTIFILVTRFSRYYLHKDPGYSKYFAILLLFLTGITILMLAGNIEFLFMGWELLGLSSFLLIGFYHHRFSAIKNSLFVFGVYRLTDLGIILASWLQNSHFPDAHRFYQLQNMPESAILNIVHSPIGLIIGLLILLSAIGKSAQFPVSFWLARAMEGPTASSAIFYGALSLHAGVFLLLRTFPLWSLFFDIRLLVFGVGLLTVIVAGISSQSQSNIKGRLAYAASVHVGLQFIELSLGYPTLALIHVICHMVVRCYQFLVSPAIVTYGLRVQNLANYQKLHIRTHFFNRFPKQIQKTLYVFSYNEGYLECFIERCILSPFSNLVLKLNVFQKPIISAAIIFSLVIIAGTFFSFPQLYSPAMEAIGISLMGFTAMTAYGEKNSVYTSWNAIGLSHFMFGLLVLFATDGQWESSPLFLFSIFGFWLLGILSLHHLFRNAKNRSLNQFHAMGPLQPKSTHFLFLAFLGILGFPLFPSFLGIDLVLHQLHHSHALWAPLALVVLMLNGISAARLYTRVSWGPTDTV